MTRSREASSVPAKVRLAAAAIAAGLALASRAAWAQGFVVTPRAEPYVPLAQIPGIAGVTPIPFADPDEDYQVPIPIGFGFVFLGASYTELGISTNGWIGFGPDARTPAYANHALPDANPPTTIIAPWWDDLAGGLAAYGTIGAAPNRTFVIELSNFRRATGGAGDAGSFEVWLFEGLERFEVHFGGALVSGLTAATSGFEGPNGFPYGALTACGGRGDCSAQDYNAMSNMAYRIDRSPTPVLTGSIGTFPRGAPPGGRAVGQVSLQNLGTGTATSVAFDLFLSTDTVLDPSDVAAGAFTAAHVPGKSTAVLSATISVPQGTAVRDYYLILQIDPQNAYPQPDPSIKIVTGPRFGTGIDLQPTFVVPAMNGALPGQTLTFNLGIQQNGVQLSGPVAVNILAAPYRIWDASDPSLGIATVNLSGAVNQTVQASLTLPPIAPGHYYPIAILDPQDRIPEYDRTNNVLIGTNTFAVGADLTIAFVRTPTTAAPGQSAPITVAVGSIGVPFAGPVPYRLYASSDMILDAADITLATQAVTFQDQASITDTATVTFPRSLAPGRYYLIAQVDPANQVMVLDRADTIAVSAMRVVDGYDFGVATDVTFMPTSLEARRTFMVTGTLKSLGAPFFGPVPYRIYLSAGTSWSQNDVAVYDGSVQMMGQDAPFMAAFAMPDRAPAGYSQVTVYVNPDHTLAEADTTNNTFTGFEQVQILGADVRVASIMASRVAFIGQPYPIDLVIANDGPSTSFGLRYGYFLSPTDIIRPTDQQIFMSGTATIAAGGVLTFHDVVTIPTLTSTETRFVGAVVFNETPDPDLSNNVGRVAGATRILFPAADLTGRIVATSSAAAAGEPLEISRELDNLGLAAAPSFEYAYYLSADAVIDTGDVLLGRFAAGLAQGASDFGSDRVVIPGSVAPGRYTVGLILDPDGRIQEVDRSHGVVVGPTITVYPAGIRFLTADLPDATVHVPYQAGVFASGGPLPIVWSVSSGALPDGLLIDPMSGILSGTPTQEGLFSFVLRAASGTSYGDAGFVLRVVPSRAPLVVAGDKLPPAIAGRDYSATLIARGGAPPYTFTSTSALPEGLLLLPAGQITGRPAIPGSASVYLTVADALGARAQKRLSFEILDPSRTLLIATNPLPSAVVGVEYCEGGKVRLIAAGGVPPYSWTKVGEAPPGMSISAAGEVCGVPETVGSFPLIGRAADASGLFATAAFIFHAVAGGDYAIVTRVLPDGILGAAYAQTIAVSGGSPPYALALVQGAGDLPAGLSLDAGGRISGTPSKSGLFAFAVSATDARRANVIQPLAIAVANSAPASSKGGCACDARGEGRGSDLPVLLLLLLLLGRFASVLRRRRPAAIIIIILFAAAASGTAAAQTVPGTPYVKTVSTIAYRDPASPSILTFSNNDSGADTVPLPFPFKFYGQVTRAITVGVNGAMIMTPMAMLPDTGHAPGDGNTPHGFIGPLWTDLVLHPMADHFIATAVEGTEPNRTITVEWKNVDSYSATGVLVSFSVRLFEGPHGRIEIDYGTPSGTGTLAAVMGMEDASGTSPILFAAGGCAADCGLADLTALSDMRIALVLDPGVDVAAVSLTAPDLGYLGGTIPVAYQVSNLHGQSAGPFLLRALLSSAPSLAQPMVIGTSTLTLAAFEDRTIDTAITVPRAIPPGSYFLGIAVDPDDRLHEVDLTDNTAAAPNPIHLLISKPDLSVERVTASTASISAGGTAAVTSSIANVGGAPVSGASVAIMLSTNPVITDRDLLLSTFTVSLDPGRAVVRTSSVTIPAGTASGLYWLGTLADPRDQIDELTKTNNGRAALTPLLVNGRGFAIATRALPVAEAGRPYTAILLASGGSAPSGVAWRITGGRLPAGLVLDGATGWIQGIASTPESATFTVEADAGADRDTKSLTLTAVDPATPLAIVDESLPPAVAGSEYAFVLLAIGQTRGATVAWSATGLPAGLQLSPGGVLGGVPETAGTSSISVTAGDGRASAMRTLTLRVVDPGVLVIIPEPLTNAAATEPYRHALAALGGAPPIVWRIDNGALPPGLNLTSDGVLQGTPSAAGSYRFIVEAHDTPAMGAPEQDASAFELVVDPASGITISTTDLPDAVLARGYDQSVHAQGGTPPYRWTVAGGQLPDGLAARTNPVSGDLRIAGQPSALGVFSVLIRVDDSLGRRTERALAVRVVDETAVPSSSKSGCHCGAVHGSERAALGWWLVLVVILARRRAHIAPMRRSA